MTVFTKDIQIKSKSENEIIKITDKVTKTIKESKIENGAVIILFSGQLQQSRP